MSVNFKIFFIITCVTAPILGFIYMRIIKRNVKIFLETKIIDKGVYKNKPVYGDKVIPIAHSFKELG